MFDEAEKCTQTYEIKLFLNQIFLPELCSTKMNVISNSFNVTNGLFAEQKLCLL